MLVADYDKENHETWFQGQHRLFAGENHPEPNLFRWWVDMREILPANIYEAAVRWANNLSLEGMKSRPGLYTLDRASPGAKWANSDPIPTAIGRLVEPLMSDLAGRQLRVSYCGVTLYFNGVPIVRHRDVGFHTYLLTWPVAIDTDYWPLHVEKPGVDGGVEVDEFNLVSPDRALIFAGHDVHHWRDPYPGQRGMIFHIRYTATEIRQHTEEEIDGLFKAGMAELENGSLSQEALEFVSPFCTSQRTVTEERHHVVQPEMFSREECEAFLMAGLHSWNLDVHGATARLRAFLRDTGPALRAGCAFGGHEHRMEIRLSRGHADLEWRRDVDDNPRHRTRIVVCLSEGLGLSFKDHGPIHLRTGDAVIFRSDREYRWPKSSPQLTAMYGLPEGFLERWRAAQA